MLFTRLDEKYRDNTVWQFIKFNFISFSITLIQLLLANLLPYVFDSFTTKVPTYINNLFDTDLINNINSKYVIDGVLTWAYLLPFFLSNLIANIYGYFVNMKFTFKGKGSNKSIIIYFIVLLLLIIISTWLQSVITYIVSKTTFKSFSRSIAALFAGLLQVAVLFPLEKYVLFKEDKNA